MARLLVVWLGLGLALAAPAHGLDLRVPAGDAVLLQTARAVGQRVRSQVELTPRLVGDERAAIDPPKDCALVRATAARQAFEGTGRFDKPHRSLRTVAVLGPQVVHAWARPERKDFHGLKGRKVAVRPVDADTVRTALGFANLGLAALLPVQVQDAVAAARAGEIDAWFEVGLPESATAEALAGLGWVQLRYKPEEQLQLLDEGWPLLWSKRAELGMAGAGEALAVPLVLVCDETVPRATAEDLVDALFAPGDATATADVPLPLQRASRKTAAKPVPTALHAGAAASYERLGPLDGPIEVQVTLWMLDVSDIDVQANTFDADFTMELRWQDARLDAETVAPFEIMNAAEMHPTAYYYISRGMWHTKNWRIHAKLRGHFDLRRYPFDRQKLQVEVEHPLMTSSELVYRCETRFGSPHVDLRRDRLASDLSLGAWQYAKVHTEETTSTYGQDEHYSRYRFVLTVERTILPFLVQVLGPLLLLLLLAWAASWIPHEKIDAKLLLTVLSLVVVVELQVGAAEHAPEIAYPTLTEYLYLFTYLSVALSVAQAIFEYRLHTAGNDAGAARVRNWGLLGSVLVFVVPTAVVFFGRLS